MKIKFNKTLTFLIAIVLTTFLFLISCEFLNVNENILSEIEQSQKNKNWTFEASEINKFEPNIAELEKLVSKYSTKPNSRNKALVNLYVGFYKFTKNKPDAFNYLFEAYKNKNFLINKEKIALLHGLASVEEDNNVYNNAIYYIKESLVIEKKIKTFLKQYNSQKKLGVLYSHVGQIDNTISNLNSSLLLLPTIQDSISNSEKTELYIELSKVFRKNNEIYKSKKFISLISNENKNDELSVLLEKAHINYEQNNLILAENELNQIIGHSDSIINTKKTIIDAHQLLSNICLKKENKTEAIDNLKKALGISNKNKFYEISKEITHDLLNILPTNDPYFNELNRSIIAFYENKNQINETELFYIKQLENLNLEEKKIIEVSNYNQIITILFIIFITSLIILLVRGYLVRKQLTIIETQNKKLENRNFEILKINHELASKNTKLEEYSKLIANDIKNSINIIKENSKMLNNDIHKSKFHIFNQITKEGNKLNELINFILLNTIKNSDKKVPPEKINFEEIINEIQLSLKNSIDLLEPKFNFPETYPTFYGYKIHLYQILKNLIENALKYSQIEASPIITIIMSKENSKLQITIEDNGIGIPLNKQKIIFQKNKQSREEDSKKGNGIGLFICSEIIKSYDGTIEVDPNTKIGTKFIITMNDIL